MCWKCKIVRQSYILHGWDVSNLEKGEETYSIIDMLAAIIDSILLWVERNIWKKLFTYKFHR